MLGKKLQDSAILAGELFDKIYQQSLDVHSGKEILVPIRHLERLLTNVRERAVELCGYSEGTHSCSTPQNRRVIDREEFLAATHEVCRVVGPRIFIAAVQEELNKELCAVSWVGTSPQRRMKMRLTISSDHLPMTPKQALLLTPSWRSRRPRPSPLDSENLTVETDHDQDALLDALLETAAVASVPQAPINRLAGTLTGRDFLLAQDSPTQGRQMPPGWPRVNETVVFFDWDDTLCPSSVLSQLGFKKSFCKGRNWQGDEAINIELQGALSRHAHVACELLRAAAAHEKVVIVTLAVQEWLQVTIQLFLPAIGSVIEELGVEVFYARKSLSKHSFRMAVLEELDLGMEMKRAAMTACLRKHKTICVTNSTPNLISIGDSLDERHALLETTYCSWPSCLCKTIKLSAEPNVESLTAELERLGSYLEALIHFPEDVNVDLDHVTLAGLTPLNKYSDRHPGSLDLERHATWSAALK